MIFTQFYQQQTLQTLLDLNVHRSVTRALCFFDRPRARLSMPTLAALIVATLLVFGECAHPMFGALLRGTPALLNFEDDIAAVIRFDPL